MSKHLPFLVFLCWTLLPMSLVAQSYIQKPNTGERLYKWDGTYLMKPGTGER